MEEASSRTRSPPAPRHSGPVLWGSPPTSSTAHRRPRPQGARPPPRRNETPRVLNACLRDTQPPRPPESLHLRQNACLPWPTSPSALGVFKTWPVVLSKLQELDKSTRTMKQRRKNSHLLSALQRQRTGRRW